MQAGTRGRRVRAHVVRSAIAAALVAAALPAAAHAEFPYPTATSNPGDYTQYKLAPGVVPNDLSGNEVWKFAATPEPGNTAVNASAAELNGVRGMSIGDSDPSAKTAWEITTGRPDVVSATTDSGIEWQSQRDMIDMRRKIWLNTGELPVPRADRAESLVAGRDCAGYTHSGYDINGDGVVDVDDWACDSRVSVDDPRRAGPPGLLIPQDLILAFSDGTDADHNGYVDDIAGWDFLDNDNDPYDDVHYGHGTGESTDAAEEVNNHNSGVSACPNCRNIPLRVGTSFVADGNNFAQAVTYATDNGADVVQEALGTIDNPRFARQAVDYAYRHGVTVIASAADEAAQHNNWPSSLPHVIVVNSVTKYDDTFTTTPASYLQLNNCTNFNAKITVSIESKECSSDATGKGGAIAELIYSEALNAIQEGRMKPNPYCTRVDGSPCPLSVSEVRQIMASGTIDGAGMADDVDFTPQPEGSCSPVPVDGCTDPFFAQPTLRPADFPLAGTRSYPARKGHDQFYGYGRANVYREMDALSKGEVPPEVEIMSPDWYSFVDPSKATLDIGAQIAARGQDYTCQVLVAPGAYPNNDRTTDTPPGDFKAVSSSWCDGSTRHDRFDGTVASLDLSDLRSRFPANATGFDGREPGAGVQTANGRPNTAPYGFVVKIVATSTQSLHGAATTMTGEDRRLFYLHHDQDLLPGFPKELAESGESSPVFADLNGDNRNELIVATAGGIVHAFESDGSELPGWPVHGDPLPFPTGGQAFRSGEVPEHHYGAFVGSAAVGDLDHDGIPEVVAADMEGKVYVWSARGRRLHTLEADPDYSGKPLAPYVNVRQDGHDRTQHGFLASVALGDVDGNDSGRLEIVAAGLDRHVYVWNDDGTSVPGFPVLVADPTKTQSVDPTTNKITFNANGARGDDQGEIVDTPAIADIGGDRRPEIIVGTNEEYSADEGDEGPLNIGDFNGASLTALAQSGILSPANGRVYAIKPSGDPDGPATGVSPFVSGWPVKPGILVSGLLPLVGEGVDSGPVVSTVNCPSGGSGPKVGLGSFIGPMYIYNADGTSCYGKDDQGRDIGLQTDGGPGGDSPALPAFGLAAFGDLGTGPTLVAPAAGLRRVLDAEAHDYQSGQDLIAAWNGQTGQFQPGYPGTMNDLQFLTGPVVADIDGLPGQEVVAGSASMDLQAYDAAGAPVNPRWPKLTGDWMIATPLTGSFGTKDTDPAAHKDVVAITRRGTILAYQTDAPACSPASSPRFHHDNANSGDSARDAVAPGVPEDLALTGAAGAGALTFTAPGDDLLCGTADHYEVFTANHPLRHGVPASATPLLTTTAPPKPAGSRDTIVLPAGSERYVGVRAVDEQGNVGRLAVIDTRDGPAADR